MSKECVQVYSWSFSHDRRHFLVATDVGIRLYTFTQDEKCPLTEEVYYTENKACALAAFINISGEKKVFAVVFKSDPDDSIGLERSRYHVHIKTPSDKPQILREKQLLWFRKPVIMLSVSTHIMAIRTSERIYAYTTGDFSCRKIADRGNWVPARFQDGPLAITSLTEEHFLLAYPEHMNERISVRLQFSASDRRSCSCPVTHVHDSISAITISTNAELVVVATSKSGKLFLLTVPTDGGPAQRACRIPTGLTRPTSVSFSNNDELLAVVSSSQCVLVYHKSEFTPTEPYRDAEGNICFQDPASSYAARFHAAVANVFYPHIGPFFAKHLRETQQISRIVHDNSVIFGHQCCLFGGTRDPRVYVFSIDGVFFSVPVDDEGTTIEQQWISPRPDFQLDSQKEVIMDGEWEVVSS